MSNINILEKHIYNINSECSEEQIKDFILFCRRHKEDIKLYYCVIRGEGINGYHCKLFRLDFVFDNRFETLKIFHPNFDDKCFFVPKAKQYLKDFLKELVETVEFSKLVEGSLLEFLEKELH